jgi:hypothetical protein
MGKAMRIHFVNPSVPTRAARRLMKTLDLPESTAFAWTAYVFGYRNWQELHRAKGTAAPSPFDDECSAEEVAARRRYQVQRLGECLAADRGRWKTADPAKIVAEWKPSSACRPEGLRFNLGLPRRTLERLALQMIGIEKPVQLKQLPRELLRDLPRSLLGDTHKDALSSARRSIRVGSLEEQAFSRRVLAHFYEEGNAVATLELARSYALGAGGDIDAGIARRLYGQVALATDGDAALQSFAKAGLASLDRAGDGWPEDVRRAADCWEGRALAGSEEDAFRVAVMCDPYKPLYREMPADAHKAVRFYRLAASTGHRQATANLAAILTIQPSLADYFSEPQHWIEMAAFYGDGAASTFRSTIEKYSGPVMQRIQGKVDEREFAALLTHIPEPERGEIREVPGLGDMVMIPPRRLIQLSTGHVYCDENGRIEQKGNDRVAESVVQSYPRNGTPLEKASWVSDMAEMFGTVDRFIEGRERNRALEA